MSLLFSLSQEASSSEQVPIPMAPSPPVTECSPRPKQQHPSPDPADVLPPGGTTSQTTLEGPPTSKQWEMTSLDKALTPICLEVLTETPVWWGRWGRSTLKDTAWTSALRTPVTYQKSFHEWSWLLSYSAPPSMRLKKYGQCQMSRGKLITH